MKKEIKSGVDLAYSDASPQDQLEAAKRLLPKGVSIWAIGSKWGCVKVFIEGLKLNKKNDIMVTLLKDADSDERQTGKLFDLINCTDF